MTFDRAAQHSYQVENHIIANGFDCGFVKTSDIARIRECLDSNTALPWPMGNSTRYGSNDRVPEALTTLAGETLRLIEVTDFKVIIEHEWPEYGNKRKVRGSFSRDDHYYKFGITDPNLREQFAVSPDGDYQIGKCILCISLGELDRGYAYKLIAAVFRQQ